METATMWVPVVVGIAAIALSLISMWQARVSTRDSQANFQKTSETLGKINERAAGTEKIVGEHFEKLMGTILNIVNTATTGPEIRKAELEAKEKEQGAKMQEMLLGILKDALESGDEQKIANFLKMGEAMTKWAKP